MMLVTLLVGAWVVGGPDLGAHRAGAPGGGGRSAARARCPGSTTSWAS